MVSINDVPADKLNQALVAELKSVKEITPPEWAMFIKTGAHRERPPVEPDWWYIRTASILRTVCKDGPIGVSKLRSRYGGRRNRGTRPEKFTKGSGAIIRKILQQLQAAGFLETKGAVGSHHIGRRHLEQLQADQRPKPTCPGCSEDCRLDRETGCRETNRKCCRFQTA